MEKTSKERILIYIFIALFIFMSIMSPRKFMSLENLQSMASQLPELGIMALGMMVVMITGGIDLSITFTAALSGIAGAFVLSTGYNPDLSGAATVLLILKALVVIILTGLCCGIFNGFLVSQVGVSPILATLGTMTMYEGISLWFTKGGAISGFPDAYQWFGNGYILFIPVQIVIFILLAILTGIFLEHTPWGRSVYMLGCNPVATLFSGVNTKKVLWQVYIYVSLMAAAAAVIMTSRYNSAKVDYGASYMLQSIAIVVLGGTDVSGGYGKVIGTVTAVFIIQTLSSGLNLMGVNRYMVDVTMGLLLICVLSLNYFVSKKREEEEIHKNQTKASRPKVGEEKAVSN